MQDEIVVTSREFRFHRRRYRELINAGHRLIVTHGQHRYAVTATVEVEVEAETLEQARALFNPSGLLRDDEVVHLALRTYLSEQQRGNARHSSKTSDDNSSREADGRSDCR